MALSKIQGAQIESPVDISAVNLTGVSTIGDLNATRVNVTGISTFVSNINILDNAQVRIGTGSDLVLFHNGNDSFVYENGTGNLVLVSALGDVTCSTTDGSGNIERFRVKGNSGNIGIGTTNPITILHLKKDTSNGSVGVYPEIRLDNDEAFGRSEITFYDGATKKAGIFCYNGDGDLRFYGPNSEMLRIQANERVGVNTNSATSTLEVHGNLDHSFRAYGNNAVNSYCIHASNEGNNSHNFRSSVDFGTSNNNWHFGAEGGVVPYNRTNIWNNDHFRFFHENTTYRDWFVWNKNGVDAHWFGIKSDGIFQTGSSGLGYFFVDNTLTSNGSAGFGTANFSQTAGEGVKFLQLHTNQPTISQVFNTNSAGITPLIAFSSADSTYKYYFKANGGLNNYQANDSNLSDINIKKDISLKESTWDCVKQWEIVNYRYKSQTEDEPLNTGVIAQQIQTVCPELISSYQDEQEEVADENGVVTQQATQALLSVREQQLYWISIKTLQEAQTRIEQLESTVADLTARITALEQ